MDNQQQGTENPKPKTSAADFFLHLGVIVALYVAVISFLNLLFNLINYSFPNAPLSYGISSDSLSVPVSLLIIFSPIYIFLSWLMNKSYTTAPEKKQLWVRKWLIYLTLFITGLAIAIDLFVLVRQFVSGDSLTGNFLLKVVSVFIVLLAVFGYYLADIRDKVAQKQNKLYAWLFGAVALLVVGLAFVIIGSPVRQQKLKIDEQKIYHLQSIQSEVVSYWQRKEKLPERLTDLEDSLSYFSLPIDPETQEPYGYSIVGPFSFELCANFNLVSETGRSSSVRYPEFAPSIEDNWAHTEGYFCYTRTIDPDRYPLIEPKAIIR